MGQRGRRQLSQAIVKENGFMGVTDAARMLRCCEEVIRRYLRAGTLVGVKMPGVGRNTKWKIPVDAVLNLLYVRRNEAVRDVLVERAGGGEEVEHRALMALAADVEVAVGPSRLVAELVRLGATDLDTLHPSRYPEVRAALLRLVP